jgi:hypothetical protein
MAENENPPAPKAPAAVVKAKKKTDDLFMPTLVEFTFTVSALILMVLFLTIVGVSLVAGATLLDIFIRAGVAMLVIGGLLMFISHQIFLEVLKEHSAPEEKSDLLPPLEK